MFESGGDEAELQDRVQTVARAVSPAAPEKTAQANSCLPAHAGWTCRSHSEELK